MSYNADVLNVMIVSPGDVPDEREIVREVLYDWNAANSKSKGIVLLPMGPEAYSFEEDDSLPGKSIFERTLEKCDILVGVFFTRMGNGIGENPSGAAESIAEHAKSGKPVILYFSGKPVLEDSVDSKKYKVFKKFKDKCAAEGLLESYDTTGELKEKFYSHLQLKVGGYRPAAPVETQIKTEKKSIIEKVQSFIDKPSVIELVQPEAEASSDAKSDKAKPVAQNLSENAAALLKEASKDKNTTIYRKRMINGTTIKTNDRNFIENNDTADTIRWEAAVRELEYKGLIKDKGYAGENYKVTDEGLEAAEMLN